MTHRLEICCSIQLSYGTLKNESSRLAASSGWQDSNLRPPAPKAGAMTGLRYTPNFVQRRERDSNPRYRFQYVSLANWWFQPLTHLSVSPKRFANIDLFYGPAKLPSYIFLEFFLHLGLRFWQ
jgi:hypothetical protein